MYASVPHSSPCKGGEYGEKEKGAGARGRDKGRRRGKGVAERPRQLRPAVCEKAEGSKTGQRDLGRAWTARRPQEEEKAGPERLAG
ncbi:hypothetical protein NDU88_005009 [Pleurodeles waltl]|uniref:Uncharacterized protein n=1 Tax=Pleurodeles waltl TaxID=8319 RepID=A0AAV7VLZ6_PLEWA|nr:hypothetical protein NDU88_005009 [Pleurodeles waltl]